MMYYYVLGGGGEVCSGWQQANGAGGRAVRLSVYIACVAAPGWGSLSAGGTMWDG